jgi:hypothetical protein
MFAMNNLRRSRASAKAIENGAERARFMRAAGVLDRMIDRGLPTDEQ